LNLAQSITDRIRLKDDFEDRVSESTRLRSASRQMLGLGESLPFVEKIIDGGHGADGRQAFYSCYRVRGTREWVVDRLVFFAIAMGSSELSNWKKVHSAAR